MSAEPLVSVSGVRGIVDDSFTPEMVERWVEGFAASIARRVPRARVVLGRDTRPSGAWALQGAVDALTRAGMQPIVVGVVPTPTVQLAVTHHRTDGGVVITGSHNPGEWNALKFLGPEGIFLSAEEMATLHNTVILSDAKRNEGSRRDSSDPPQNDRDAITRHTENILALPIDAERIRARKFRIVLDPVNGTGALAVPQLLEAFGCSVNVINGEPTGQFAHVPEPTPANLQELGTAVREQHADLGVAVDPDADRLVLVDEHGEVLSEEYTVTLAALSVLESQRSARSPIVVNLSTTRMVDDVARQFGTSVIRTPVGERHVVEGMRAHGALIGGEGNGGVIFPKSHEGRDSLVGVALVLDLLSRRNASLTQLVQTLPQYVMTKEKLPRDDEFNPARIVAAVPQAFPNAQITTLDGIRVDTADGWVHLRSSNTEPILRLITEGTSQQTVARLSTTVHALLAVPA
ncbi:MAG: phosphomannomutase [Parcubacteria group bacterium Gr01-1014_38]|nr:MAG: phosphomannomutase [Parcubacteria group bacterium Gr01-1014_38]